ncbi:MAG: lipase family protein [Bacteroidota bacterium]
MVYRIGVLLLAVLFVAGCSDETENDDTFVAGEILLTQDLQTLTAAEAGGLGAALGIEAAFGVEVLRIEYATTDANGEPTMASGALAIPVGAGPVPILSYQHGTIVRKSDAPSVSADGERALGNLMASVGYIVAMPDYLGLGTGPGLHPYVHSATQASATIDMLRAVRTYLGQESIETDGRILLTGISQGAHATLAAQQVMESQLSSEFEVAAVAALSGPYDISGAMYDIMVSEEPYDNAYYLPYVTLAYDEVYDLFESPSEYFAEPYAQTIPPLFDGQNGAGTINDAMPRVPSEALQPDLLAAVTSDENHPYRNVLRENDLYDGWTPQAPMRLYHCAGDDVVPISNTALAAERLAARGADVTFIDPIPTAGHDFLCFSLAYRDALPWIAGL